ncbi:hypothetical protein ZOSMA_123G00720 [Zostera marina]|uniref:MATE efflux family protein n=1 Tax=Zostera marina TaxID=29655 RepID=A0A0K9Q0P7_ZOSMR|nr:hypothetical protein ZOSMA_123G00720 [Zostera marina]
MTMKMGIERRLMEKIPEIVAVEPITDELLLLRRYGIFLEYRYYSILILLSSTFNNAEIAVDALTISLNINGWVLMFAIAFFAGTRVRVANELGSGNGEAAKFATKVSVCTSLFIGFIFSCLIIGLQASCKSARAINRAAFSQHM